MLSPVREGLGLLPWELITFPDSLARVIKRMQRHHSLTCLPHERRGCLLWEHQTSHSHPSFMLSEGCGGPSGWVFSVQTENVPEDVLLCAPWRLIPHGSGVEPALPAAGTAPLMDERPFSC